LEKKIKPMTGAEAAAEAMKQIDPDVVAVYPITPQTPIVETFAQFVADGEVKTELIRVESEHSAMSAVVGASTAGARAMTASSSAGLALMWEILGIASGHRLPIVMHIANRALSGPINIHCDHSDSMGCRDHGWIQIYSENAQEVYENTFLAVRLAEKVLLPVMIMQDGFITSHAVQKVKLYPELNKFAGEYKPEYYLLNIKKPFTAGPLELTDYYFESKYQQAQAILKAKEEYLKIGKELEKITGNKYDLFEEYKLKDAERVIVTSNSTAGATKDVVDLLRKNGEKVGLLKIKLFRPFPYEEIAKALEGRKIAVLDRSESFGAYPPLYGEIRSALFNKNKTFIQSYVFGLGGREIFNKDIEAVFNDLKSEKQEFVKYIGVRT